MIRPSLNGLPSLDLVDQLDLALLAAENRLHRLARRPIRR